MSAGESGRASAQDLRACKRRPTEPYDNSSPSPLFSLFPCSSTPTISRTFLLRRLPRTSNQTEQYLIQIQPFSTISLLFLRLRISPA